VGPKILIIDDETLPTGYYVRALQREGFSVSQSHSVDQALEAIEHERLTSSCLIS
jgi:DNA-binding response OmpR family regulator